MCFCARQHGFSLNRHRSRPVDRKLVKKADLLLTMSDRQKKWILDTFPETEGRVFQIMEYGDEGRERDFMPQPGGEPPSFNMPDPTGREAADFQSFIDLARSEADRLLHELVHRQIL
jgi:protein-tyrosine-phosphatase